MHFAEQGRRKSDSTASQVSKKFGTGQQDSRKRWERYFMSGITKTVKTQMIVS